MALEAGSINVRIKGDTTDLNKSLDEMKKTVGKVSSNTKKSFGSMVKSIAGIGIALVLAKKAFDVINKTIKESISLASDFQETNQKFGVIFRDVKKEAESMSKVLVNSFGLSSLQAKKLLGNTGDLLTGLGFTQQSALDLSNQVNQLAADLASFSNIEGGAERASAALTSGLLGEREAMKSLGIVIREEDIKLELLKQGMSDLTGEALTQAKAQITLQLAIRQSQNAIGDFSRSSQSFANVQKTLNNRIQDLKITLGKALLPAFNVMNQTVLKVITSFDEFLNSGTRFEEISSKIADVAGKIAGGFAVLSVIAKDLFGIAFKTGKTIITDIIDIFSDLNMETGSNITGFTILAGIMETMSSAMNIAVAVIRLIIQQIVNLGAIVFNVAKVVGSFFQALVDPRKWGEVKNNVKSTKESFVKLVKDIADNTGKVIKTVITEVSTLSDRIKEKAEEMEISYSAASVNMEKAFVDAISNMNKAQEKTMNDMIITVSDGVKTLIMTWGEYLKTLEKVKVTTKELDGVFSLIAKSIDTSFEGLPGTINTVASSMLSTMDNMFKIMEEKSKFAGSKILAGIKAGLEGAKQIASAVFSEIISKMEESLDVLDEQRQMELERVNENLQAELESRGLAEETKTEILNREIEEIKKKLNTEVDAENEAELKKDLNKKMRELERNKLEAKALKKRDKIDSDFKLKIWQKEVEVFNTQKAANITNIAILGLTGAIAAFAGAFVSIPNPIAAAIVGAIAATAVGGLAIANAAIVATKQPPPKPAGLQFGGFVPGTSTAGDNTPVNANAEEMFITKQQQRSLLNFIQGGAQAAGNTLVQVFLDSEEMPIKNTLVTNQNEEGLVF